MVLSQLVAEPALTVEALGLPPGVDVDLLGDLLGLSPVPQHPEHDPEDGARRGVVHLGESLLVSLGHPCHEATEIGALVVAGRGVHVHHCAT